MAKGNKPKTGNTSTSQPSRATNTSTQRTTSSRGRGRTQSQTTEENERTSTNSGRKRQNHPSGSQQQPKKPRGDGSTASYAKTPRAVFNSESDDASDGEDPMNAMGIRRRGPEEDDAASLSSAPAHTLEEAAGDDEDDDLRDMDGPELRDTFARESARFDNDDNDFDGSDNDHGVSGVRQTEDFYDDDEDDGTDGSYEPVTSQARKEPSLRAAQRKKEEPSHWKVVVSSKAKSKNKKTEGVDVNASWNLEAHYVPRQGKARTIALLIQPKPFQDVLKAAIIFIIANTLFVTFFPDVSNEYRELRKLLKAFAKKLNYLELAERISKDVEMGKEGARVLNHRVVWLRGKAKAAVASIVGSEYGIKALRTTAERRELVRFLLHDGQYVFPQLEPDKLDFTKGYQHPCIIAGIQAFFFAGSRGAAFAQRFRERLSSSLKDYSEELEIPHPVVAIICTAIQGVLEEWVTGNYRPTDFNSDLLEDIYKGHDGFFDKFKKDHPGRYHVLLHEIYKECSEGTQYIARRTNFSDALEKSMDINAMRDVTPK